MSTQERFARTRRTLFVVAVLTVLVWVASLFTAVAWVGNEISIGSESGKLFVTWYPPGAWTPPNWPLTRIGWVIEKPLPSNSLPEAIGLEWPMLDRGPIMQTLTIPHLLFTASFAALALLLPRRHRLRAGSCRACGDDLAGNVTGRCSECDAPTKR